MHLNTPQSKMSHSLTHRKVYNIFCHRKETETKRDHAIFSAQIGRLWLMGIKIPAILSPSRAA